MSARQLSRWNFASMSTAIVVSHIWLITVQGNTDKAANFSHFNQLSIVIQYFILFPIYHFQVQFSR